MKGGIEMFILAYAEARSGRGTVVRPADQRRRGPESMSAYYRRTGMSAMGGNARTRGRLAPIVPVTRGR